MKLLVLPLMLLLSLCIYGQSEEIRSTNAAEIVDLCDTEATFPGGTKAFHKYIQKHLNLTGIPGFTHEDDNRLYVSFIIDESGAMQKLKVAQTSNKMVIEEIERVFNAMPEWTPGDYGGKLVKTRVMIPIKVQWLEPIPFSIL